MHQFLETIKYSNGIFFNKELHNARFNSTRKHFFPAFNEINLFDHIQIPFGLASDKTYKCRVIYNQSIVSVSFEAYVPTPVNIFHVINCPTGFDYSYKFFDRTFFNHLRSKASPGEEFILIKNGFVTDSTYANLVFDDGEKLYTPSTPLLNGVKRTFLLQQGIVFEAEISVADIFKFQRISMVNAMVDLGEIPFIPTSNCKFS